MDSVRRLVEDSLVTLTAEAPVHARMLADLLHGHRLVVEVGRERFAVQGRDGEVFLCGRTDDDVGGLNLRASPETILSLLQGRARVVELLAGDELFARGSSEQLQTTSRALHIALHGLIRTSSGAELLRRLEHMTEGTS